MIHSSWGNNFLRYICAKVVHFYYILCLFSINNALSAEFGYNLLDPALPAASAGRDENQDL